MNFGLLTTKFTWLMITHPKSTFSEDIILALRGCYPLQFFHVLQTDQGMTWYQGQGFPQHENLKIGPKFGVFWLITLGPVQITPPNFYT